MPELGFSIRLATPDDATTLVRLIDQLAAYEKLSHESRPDAEALASHLAEDAGPRCEALLAEDMESGRCIGFALFFHNYSTFLTSFGIYLEDLFVVPTYRGHGVGFALLSRLCRIARERGCDRVEWSVLDWNEPAIDFYRKIGAKSLDDWISMRLETDAIAEVADAF